MKQKSIALLLVSFSPFAHAHSGGHHGNMLSAVLHLVSEPDHLAMVLIVMAIGVAGARFYRRCAVDRIGNARR